MLKIERQQAILNQLRRDGKVLAVDLSRVLNVSEDTIRRDLNELSAAGKMQRVHGGGLPHSPAEVSYGERLKMLPEAKAEIARTALKLIKDGQVILMDGGTTTLQVARCLPVNLRAMVVTNSLPVAAVISEHPGVELLFLGGLLYKHSQVVVGSMTLEALRSIHADLCLLGVCSLHIDVGVSVRDMEEAQIKRQMIAASSEVAALVTADKLQTASSFVVAPVTDLTCLVTSTDTPAEALLPYRNLGLKIYQ